MLPPPATLTLSWNSTRDWVPIRSTVQTGLFNPGDAPPCDTNFRTQNAMVTTSFSRKGPSVSLDDVPLNSSTLPNREFGRSFTSTTVEGGAPGAAFGSAARGG